MFLRGDKAGPGKSSASFSFIGAEVTVTGDIATTGRLQIDGKVIGDVRCVSLIQGESGTVHGNIAADEARLAGLVDGAVEAGTLGLEPSARITGDVLYESLSIAAGAEIEGRFKRRRGTADGSAVAKIEAAVPPTRRASLPELFPTAEPAAEAAE